MTLALINKAYRSDIPVKLLKPSLTSSVNLHVLLQAAFLVEAPPTELTAERLLARVNPFVPLQVSGSFETLPAVRADEALLKHQPLHRPPPHRVVQGTVLARAQEATAGGVQAGIQRGL